jgi:hypothetical protein
MLGRSRAYEQQWEEAGRRIFLLDLAECRGFPYKPAAINPGKCRPAPPEPCMTLVHW